MRIKQPPIQTPFGASLRKLRSLKRLTLRQLSEMTADKGQNPITVQHLDKIERGAVKSPGVDIASRIATVLGARLEVVRGHSVLEIKR